MPHITLEYTRNTTTPDNWKTMLLAIHQTLEDVGGIAIANCKSRMYVAEQFIIADNQQAAGFVHLEIVFVAGRSEQVKAEISSRCLEILKAAFLPINQLPLQITVNIGDIPLTTYSKFPEGTLGYQQP